ncbi:MAG TPA: tRNA (N(6)-L-threonylcarbamoyladenosine(37)-C(2))-methylthiotransferase MtaB [Desulfitobacteriaceae bacterium]|jgi:threonylcarbamoyladenosine tRNA methylthiotransferase MtaB|nr:tRNA (N(6)-L-threonylcarbamoyladenosine(37)-C(2))-methylthiotransferase MtaB [Desulfitobacteriaceae bacterium]
MVLENNKRSEEDPKVCFITLGCKVNQTESEAMAQLFRNAGYQTVDSGRTPDVVVINTCTVTNMGGRKSRQAIRRAVRAFPESLVIVTGCYSQTASDEVLDIPGVDLVLGTQDRMQVLQWIEHVRQTAEPYNAVRNIWNAKEFEEFPQIKEESRTRAMLKIEEGCNRFCTYCIIPFARGPVRSRLPGNALAEAERLVKAGYREIVLTGIHIGAYGEDLEGNWDLARLVRMMLKIPEIHRLRLGSIEPVEFSEELIDTITASPAICPHLHIPLQSGSPEILAGMRRLYTPAEYRNLLERLFQSIPRLAVTTDVIVGFPGESEADHAQTLEFARACGFAGIHVFPYSKRKGTPAAAYADQVPDRVKARRVKEMLHVSRESRQAYINRILGQTVEVLVERVDAQGQALGHTENYLTVTLPSQLNGKNWKEGQVVSVLLNEKHIYPEKFVSES